MSEHGFHASWHQLFRNDRDAPADASTSCHAGRPTATPVVLLHGNFSAATFWEDLMLHASRARPPLRCAGPARLWLDRGQADRRDARLPRMERRPARASHGPQSAAVPPRGMVSEAAG
jgi:hypothetical protein